MAADKTWRIVDEYASIILRDYERYHETDEAMQPIFEEQHEHDALQAAFPDSFSHFNDAEAVLFLGKLQQKYENTEEILCKDYNYDGSYGHAYQQELVDYDNRLKMNPRSLSTYKLNENKYLKNVSSMLRVDRLKATRANCPEKTDSMKKLSRSRTSVNLEYLWESDSEHLSSTESQS